MKAYVVAFCGVFLTTSALAQPSSTAGSAAEQASPTAAPESANQSSDREPRQICRHVQADASSRVRARRVCHTAEEWREIQDAS